MKIITTNKARVMLRELLGLSYEIDRETVCRAFDQRDTIGTTTYWEEKPGFIAIVENMKEEVQNLTEV